jgi:glucose-1-phosphate thymidylyltransferase
MKGVILAGGTGSRLLPMTRVTNKHLLPVYDRPMIMYPLGSLVQVGMRDILIVSGKGHAGHFLELLGSGEELGVRLSYAVQEAAGGIAQALLLAEKHAEGGPVAVMLGDNIFEETPDATDFSKGARIFIKETDSPQRFGVPTLEGEKVVAIHEKPERPATGYAVTGFYMYDNSVFDKIRRLSPSKRGELEITDVNNMYIEEGGMDSRVVGGFWTDAGTVESLYLAGTLIRNKKTGSA